MLRILVAVFFWLCAAGLLALSIHAEISDSRKPLALSTKRTIQQAHNGHMGR